MTVIPSTAASGWVNGSSKTGNGAEAGSFGRSHTTTDPEVVGWDGNYTHRNDSDYTSTLGKGESEMYGADQYFNLDDSSTGQWKFTNGYTYTDNSTLTLKDGTEITLGNNERYETDNDPNTFLRPCNKPIFENMMEAALQMLI